MIQLDADYIRSATPGMQAFNRLETVDGEPLTATIGLFISDALWEQLGKPTRVTITMEPSDG